MRTDSKKLFKRLKRSFDYFTLSFVNILLRFMLPFWLFYNTSGKGRRRDLFMFFLVSIAAQFDQTNQNEHVIGTLIIIHSCHLFVFL